MFLAFLVAAMPNRPAGIITLKSCCRAASSARL